jgi:rare lipoprotein A
MRIQKPFRSLHSAAGIILVISGGLIVSACSSGSKVGDPFAGTGSPIYKKSGPIPKGGGRRHVGKPYSVAGRKFYPRADPDYDRVGIASWYGKRFHRRKTANGEWYDMNAFTAAHKTMPLPSYARVTNLATGRSLVVRVNDRGPFVGNRIIDLSRKSADFLGTKNKGTAKVRVKYIGPAPLNDDGTHLASMNRGKAYTRVAAAARPTVSGTSSFTHTRAGYYVQVGAYGVRANATRAKHNAQRLGSTVIAPASSSYGTVYRVRIGPLSTRTQAIAMQQRAVNYGHYDAKIITQ